jgi:hypothetical protein
MRIGYAFSKILKLILSAMCDHPETPPCKSSASHQLVLILSNSKYTYSQFRAFHTTVLGLLNYKNLLQLSAAQKRSTIFFTDIIVSLLNAPSSAVYPQCTCTLQPQPFKGALSGSLELKENLQKLLAWIDILVRRKEIILEALLDEFFSLELIDDLDTNVN